MLTKRLLSHRRSAGTALTALHWSTPTAVPTRWSPLTVLLPSHTPSCHSGSKVASTTFGSFPMTHSPNSSIVALNLAILSCSKGVRPPLSTWKRL